MRGQHPTREALISTVVKMLDDFDPEAITSEHVLELSKISRGSMYHHFEDFSELSRDELVAQVREITRITQSDQVKENRFERMFALARAVHSPRMKKNLGIEQERLTENIADLYRVVLEKGWGNPTLSPRTVAVLIQSYSLGKVVDDVTEEHMASDDWLNLINTILESAIFPPQ